MAETINTILELLIDHALFAFDGPERQWKFGDWKRPTRIKSRPDHYTLAASGWRRSVSQMLRSL